MSRIEPLNDFVETKGDLPPACEICGESFRKSQVDPECCHACTVVQGSAMEAYTVTDMQFREPMLYHCFVCHRRVIRELKDLGYEVSLETTDANFTRAYVDLVYNMGIKRIHEEWKS